MPTECCVPGCLNRSGHAFPWSDKTRMKAWKIAVKRDQWEPSKHSVVCKRHFTESDYEGKTAAGTKHLQKRLKKSAVPHVFPWLQEPSKSAIHRIQRAKKRQVKFEADDRQRLNVMQDIGAVETVVCENTDQGERNGLMEASTLTDNLSKTDSATQTEFEKLTVLQTYRCDHIGIHYYTGLENYDKIMFVLNTLGPAAYELTYYHLVKPKLEVEDQFFLTLVKLRRSFPNFELGRMFKISEASVTNTFVTWINFMAYQWGEINWWPSRELVSFYSPSDFYSKFPTTRVTIDGTECPIMKPGDPLSQQATFSSYKNRNTVKVLAGLTPGGLVSYVSDAYGGSASDRQICERSNLMTMCDPGDSIMSDKGFNVQDLFESKMVTVNIPSFFRKKNRLSGKCVMNDRKIASKRVHVERIIGLAKTYTILKKPLNRTESLLASQIIKVCFYLCNFRSNIVSNDA